MRKLILALSLASITSQALANDPTLSPTPAKGFFVGAAFGQANLDDDGFYGDIGSKIDDKDSASEFTVGYRLNQHIALMGSYVNLGEYSGRDFYDTKASADYSAVAFVGEFIFPFANNRFEVFGRGGLGVITAEQKVEGYYSYLDESDESSGSDLIMGGGIRFNIPGVERLSVSAGVDNHMYEVDTDGDEEDSEYSQSILVSKLGANFRF